MNKSQKKIKFSIVTPTYNAAKYLSQTISSVVAQQGNFDIEYILVDNESTDSTLEIIEGARVCLEDLNCKRASGSVTMQVISQKDTGMYEAINRGFARARGEIFAWINADDLYMPDAFAKVAEVFQTLPEVQWLKGVTSYIDENSENYQPGKCYIYAQELINRGIYGREACFIQQDSVFWRRNLWCAVGGVDSRLRLAGDYDLWLKFARIEPLYSLNLPVSCFRRVSGQLSEDLKAYREEQSHLGSSDNLRSWLMRKYFALLESRLPDCLNFKVFRLLFPSAPLYYIDCEREPLTIINSNRYLV